MAALGGGRFLMSEVPLQGPRGVPGGWEFSYGRGTPAHGEGLGGPGWEAAFRPLGPLGSSSSQHRRPPEIVL